VTSKLPGRIYQHREGLFRGFTKTHGLKRLVWFQSFELMTDAIHREKQIKKYRREWKLNLIEEANLYWDDLYPSLFTPPKPRPASLVDLPTNWPVGDE
jgi:putative endonuclease